LVREAKGEKKPQPRGRCAILVFVGQEGKRRPTPKPYTKRDSPEREKTEWAGCLSDSRDSKTKENACTPYAGSETHEKKKAAPLRTVNDLSNVEGRGSALRSLRGNPQEKERGESSELDTNSRSTGEEKGSSFFRGFLILSEGRRRGRRWGGRGIWAYLRRGFRSKEDP